MDEETDFMEVDDFFEEDGINDNVTESFQSDALVSQPEADEKPPNVNAELTSSTTSKVDGLQDVSKSNQSRTRRSRSRDRRSRSRQKSSHSKSHKKRSRTPNRSKPGRSKSRSRRSRRSRSRSRSKRSRSSSKISKSKEACDSEPSNGSEQKSPSLISKDSKQDAEAAICQDYIALDKSSNDKGESKGTDPNNSLLTRHKENKRSKHKSRHSRSRSRSRSKRSSHRARRKRRKHSTSSSSGDSSKSRSRSPRVNRSPTSKKRRISSPLSNRKRHIGEKAAPPPSTSIILFGLPLTFSETDLIKLIPEAESAISPSSASVIKDRQSGISRGFGFMNYDSVDTATVALEFLQNQCEFIKNSVEIKCNFSITHRAHSPTPNHYLGCKKTLASLRHLQKVNHTAWK